MEALFHWARTVDDPSGNCDDVLICGWGELIQYWMSQMLMPR